MTMAILQTGDPPEALKPRFGDYPSMFRRLLGPESGAPLRAFRVKDGEWPHAVGDFDAYLITGSAAGVYDDLPWIDPLKAFLREARGRAALVGVCFGHQIMADAFGGRVVKSDKGWGVGLHSYRILTQAPWMDPVAAVAVPASHQDQVVEPPPGARVLAASDFTPYAALAYGDQPAISFQFHPEFSSGYAAALIESGRGTRYTETVADAAVASLAAPNDRLRVAAWIRQFLSGQAATSLGRKSGSALG